MQWEDSHHPNGFYCFSHFRSCVADNALGRAKKYIEVSGKPGPAQFHSPLYSRSRDVYNLTWSVESVPKLDEIRILYRKLMVSCPVRCCNFKTDVYDFLCHMLVLTKLIKAFFSCNSFFVIAQKPAKEQKASLMYHHRTHFHPLERKLKALWKDLQELCANSHSVTVGEMFTFYLLRACCIQSRFQKLLMYVRTNVCLNARSFVNYSNWCDENIIPLIIIHITLMLK